MHEAPTVTPQPKAKAKAKRRRMEFERVRLPRDDGTVTYFWDEHGNLFADFELRHPLGMAIVKTVTRVEDAPEAP